MKVSLINGPISMTCSDFQSYVWGFRRVQGEPDGETCSLPWRAFDGDAAAVFFDDPSCERQAEPYAGDAFRTRRLGAVEALEDMREGFRRNADSLIGNEQLRTVVFRSDGHLNAAAIGRKFDGVVQ